MAATVTTNTRKAAVMLILTTMALLPPSILGARTRPSSPHHSQGHKRSPPPPASPSPPPPPPPSPPATPAGLVRATCNATAYYDLCVSTLTADPSSATADVRGLSSIAVSAAAANASGGAATAVALATTGGGNGSNATAAAGDGTVQALLRTCGAKYGDARDALSAARDSIAQENYDYAAVHVSAAGEYPQVCRVLFQRQRPGEYPPELADREEALRRLCAVALDIITLLSNNTN